MKEYKPKLGESINLSPQFYGKRRRRSHKIIDNIDHKRCTKCREFKTLDMFHPDISGRSWDRLTYYCKPCYNQHNLLNTRWYRERTSDDLEKLSKEAEEYQIYMIGKNKELDYIIIHGYDRWYWDSLMGDIR